ncbi:golgi-associated plant pathogenesis-related protein 1 [Caerostris extrusa]|uniref:Golgi-associated plant pathogenesis-related protein 1 n=1 Tax=Caerostris extrusa TaxID=172846 RepID=A0AAV4URA2_CAEEX|nr:golgi-associated plant pathogenesis-related protein 1 [Caerostris extrusa]
MCPCIHRSGREHLPGGSGAALQEGGAGGEGVVQRDQQLQLQQARLEKRCLPCVSQLLWKSTTEIGVGVAKIPGQNKAYVVVNYRPAGNNNMPGEFERNVLPPQKMQMPDNNANMRKNINRR